MQRITDSASRAQFESKLRAYKSDIDAEIAEYSKQQSKNTEQFYGPYAKLEVDTFLDILSRGGKRIRGALVMAGYEMSGGTDKKLIVQVARALEMVHAHLLIIDDIQDRSATRRGKPSAHMLIAEYHRAHNLAGSAEHFGISVALNSAISGAAAAQMLLANIDADPQLRLNVLGITNRTMKITAHGQTGDIMNEVVPKVSEKDVVRVMERKTSTYTVLNPLHVGMVLAGADCHSTDAITAYAMHVGQAFQITDDIVGVFGSEKETGKNPMDDIREGKRTLLVVHALQNGTKEQEDFLKSHLGNENLSETDFEQCRVILEDTGAKAYAQEVAKDHVAEALGSLEEESQRWNPEIVQFLGGLAQYVLNRTS